MCHRLMFLNYFCLSEFAVITAALRWLSGPNVTRTIIVTDSQSFLRKIQNRCMWHEWAPQGELSNERADRLASTVTMDKI